MQTLSADEMFSDTTKFPWRDDKKPFPGVFFDHASGKLQFLCVHISGNCSMPSYCKWNVIANEMLDLVDKLQTVITP